ncbi:MAG: 30S ribosomal protein S17 [Candidatus Pacebacteria bacterium]|jgi:small subunit ribosomal protein S17|nr:30S ribosomal protein S17 [Candidatus Paceibacterota bacterium]
MDTKTQLKTLTGVVVSTKMKDTVTVKVNRFVKDAKYKKYVLRSKKYLAHAPGNTLAEGDRVTIRSSRPISKRKHFIVVN